MCVCFCVVCRGASASLYGISGTRPVFLVEVSEGPDQKKRAIRRDVVRWFFGTCLNGLPFFSVGQSLAARVVVHVRGECTSGRMMGSCLGSRLKLN